MSQFLQHILFVEKATQCKHYLLRKITYLMSDILCHVTEKRTIFRKLLHEMLNIVKPKFENSQNHLS
jgi:hypothetical protein